MLSFRWGKAGEKMSKKPVMSWVDFFSAGSISGMILKIAQPYGKPTLWGEVVSGQVLASGEVEFVLAWISDKNPMGKRAYRCPASEPVVIRPRCSGPFYCPRGSTHNIPDVMVGLVHQLLPPIGSARAIARITTEVMR